MSAVRSAVVGAWLCAMSVAAVAQGASQAAREQCQKTAPATATMVQGLWKTGGLKGDVKLPSRDVGGAFVALLSIVRDDPALLAMSHDEFVSLAIQICTPIYETYFSHLAKKEPRRR